MIADVFMHASDTYLAAQRLKRAADKGDAEKVAVEKAALREAAQAVLAELGED